MKFCYDRVSSLEQNINLKVDTSLWPHCQPIGVVDPLRAEQHKEPQWERRYYMSSRALNAHDLAQAVRAHWGIENQLHWVLDVDFCEEASTVRKDYAPQNLSLYEKNGD